MTGAIIGKTLFASMFVMIPVSNMMGSNNNIYIVSLDVCTGHRGQYEGGISRKKSLLLALIIVL